MRDCFRNDIDHGDGEEESAREGHGQIHHCFVAKTSEAGDAVPEDGDFEKEGDHEGHLDGHYASHF